MKKHCWYFFYHEPRPERNAEVIDVFFDLFLPEDLVTCSGCMNSFPTFFFQVRLVVVDRGFGLVIGLSGQRHVYRDP